MKKQFQLFRKKAASMLALFFMISVILYPISVDAAAGQNDNRFRIRITVGDQDFSAELYDNETAQAWLEQMPMTLAMNELNGNEKYHYFSESLPTNPERPDAIHTGDLMLYGQSCLVLFYKDFTTSYSYTPLGYMEDAAGLAKALGNGNVTVSFRLDDGEFTEQPEQKPPVEPSEPETEQPEQKPPVEPSESETEQSGQEQLSQEQVKAQEINHAGNVVKLAKGKKKLKIIMQVGDTLTLKAAWNTGKKTSKKVTWKSSNKKVAAVNKKGKVKAKKTGTTIITATTKDKRGKVSCKIKVKRRQEADSVMNIQIGKKVFTAKLADNSSARALAAKLAKSSITISMKDYGGFEKVGSFGFSLVTNNQQITTEPGDLVLYQGNQLVIFYGKNSWSYTRLGKIQNVTAKDLKTALGDGDVTVTLSLP